RRRRFRAPLFAESVPTIKAGEGKTGIVTACGEVTIGPSVDLFGGLSAPIIILLAESARPTIGTRALTEALLAMPDPSFAPDGPTGRSATAVDDGGDRLSLGASAASNSRTFCGALRRRNAR